MLEIPLLRARREDLERLMINFLRLELERVGEGHRLDAPRSAGTSANRRPDEISEDAESRRVERHLIPPSSRIYGSDGLP